MDFRRFQPSNVKARFEMFILHYIMEYVCWQFVQPKRWIYNYRLHKIIMCVPYGFIMRRKYFAGNFSPFIITNNEYLAIGTRIICWNNLDIGRIME